MFFIASKILSFLIDPFLWIVIFIILALVARKKYRRNKYLWTGFVLFIFFSNTFIYNSINKLWNLTDTDLVENYEYVEKQVRSKLDSYRPQKNKEHFTCSVPEAIIVIEDIANIKKYKTDALLEIEKQEQIKIGKQQAKKEGKEANEVWIGFIIISFIIYWSAYNAPILIIILIPFGLWWLYAITIGRD